MERLAQGDESALDALYEALSRNVFALALRMMGSREDAEEVVQDTFVQTYRYAARFDARRGSVRAWIYTVARNQCRMRLRAHRARPRSDTEMDPHDAASTLPTRSHASQATARLTVQQAFSHLSHDEARLLEAAFFEGFSHGELADHEGEPVGTIKSRIRRAMLKARKALTDRASPNVRATRSDAATTTAARGASVHDADETGGTS